MYHVSQKACRATCDFQATLSKVLVEMLNEKKTHWLCYPRHSPCTHNQYQITIKSVFVIDALQKSVAARKKNGFKATRMDGMKKKVYFKTCFICRWVFFFCCAARATKQFFFNFTLDKSLSMNLPAKLYIQQIILSLFIRCKHTAFFMCLGIECVFFLSLSL